MTGPKKKTYSEVRISAELFMRNWAVTIGVYPPGCRNFYYGEVAEGEGKTLQEALKAARQQWRDIKQDERED